jgi:hypothetical protein
MLIAGEADLASLSWLRALGLAGLGLIGVADKATATEPFPSVTQWGGFYLGGELGGASGETDWRYANAN